jgi:hypothetical protein
MSDEQEEFEFPTPLHEWSDADIEAMYPGEADACESASADDAARRVDPSAADGAEVEARCLERDGRVETERRAEPARWHQGTGALRDLAQATVTLEELAPADAEDAETAAALARGCIHRTPCRTPCIILPNQWHALALETVAVLGQGVRTAAASLLRELPRPQRRFRGGGYNDVDVSLSAVVRAATEVDGAAMALRELQRRLGQLARLATR